MSSEYEQDEECRSLFLYALNTLSKPFVVAAIGSDLNWKQTDLGLAIGDEVGTFDQTTFASFQLEQDCGLIAHTMGILL